MRDVREREGLGSMTETAQRKENVAGDVESDFPNKNGAIWKLVSIISFIY